MIERTRKPTSRKQQCTGWPLHSLTLLPHRRLANRHNVNLNDRNVLQMLTQKLLCCLFQAKDLWRCSTVYKYKGHNEKGCIWLGKRQVCFHQNISGIDWVYVLFVTEKPCTTFFFTCLISIPYSSECLMFYSKFECGNLRKAIQVRRYVILLFLLVLWQLFQSSQI